MNIIILSWTPWQESGSDSNGKGSQLHFFFANFKGANFGRAHLSRKLGWRPWRLSRSFSCQEMARAQWHLQAPSLVESIRARDCTGIDILTCIDMFNEFQWYIPMMFAKVWHVHHLHSGLMLSPPSPTWELTWDSHFTDAPRPLRLR